MNTQSQRSGFLVNMPVGRRIFLLILIPLLLLLVIGISSIISLNQNEQTMESIRYKIDSIDAGNAMINTTHKDYIILLYEVVIGSRTWDDGAAKLSAAEKVLREDTIPRYKAIKENDGDNLSQADQDAVNATIKQLDVLVANIQTGIELLKQQSRAQLELYLLNDLQPDTQTARNAVSTQVQSDISNANAAFSRTTEQAHQTLILEAALVVIGFSLAILFSYFIYRSISGQISRLVSTIRELSSGNLNARVNLIGNNEFAELGQSFDSMVEDRIATQERIDADHRQLNDSVFALLDAVADLSERNLTVRARVTEDATGPLADAINQLAEDTTEVLQQVRKVALSVESSSEEVNRHALSVNELSALERTEAEETTEQLGKILVRLDTIAESAQSANQVAGTTSQSTQDAQVSVSRTLNSMSGIRTTVQETGKRLKRLGERSQEISRIIDIINTISERTAVLALNASMQATAAGEAGRGFSMIAEEIQRLAESSHESTDQIAVLVRNIQQEANTTMATMDQTIAEVVDGSTLAEQAAKQMEETLQRTTQLVESVEQIATASAEQVDISKSLQTRAERILDATQLTGKELLSLTKLTSGMADSGKQLVQSVGVFKLEA